MIDQLKPYPAYKDSGVEWLGKVPEHWEVRKLKCLCSRSALYGANVSAAEYTTNGIRFLRTTDIMEDGRLKDQGVFLPESLVRDYILSDGDLLISRSGTIGRSFLYDKTLHGSCAYAGYLVRFVPGRAVVPKYLFLFTKTEAFAGFLRAMAISSTIDNVNGDKYANCPLGVPPLPEQTAIVRFLDYMDRRIRRYVRARQKQIKLLEEYRQTLISEAVTGKIDVRTGKPYPAYKDSGVEWLGQVPEHWEVRRIRTITEMRVSNVDKHSNEGEKPVRLCNYVDVYKHERIHANMQFMRATASEEEIERFRLRPGDVLITKDSEMWDDIGVPALVEASAPDLISGYHLALLRPKQLVEGPFLLRSLQSRPVAYQFHVKAQGVTRYGLSHEAIKSTLLSIPPLPEQTAIVEYLDAQTAKIDAAIAAARREIELLREYLERLIADVVTGKVDVREVAEQLPEEPPEEIELMEEDELAEIKEENNEEGDALTEEISEEEE